MLYVPAPDIGPRTAAHALNRLGYGARPGEVGRLLAGGIDRWIEDQLDAPADPDLEARLRAYPALTYPIAQVLQAYAADQRSIATVLDQLFTAKMVRAVHGRNQLQEVLADFWFNHFNVFVGDGFDRFSIHDYERVAIRPHVLGRFQDLLAATANHPTMMFYLDNYLSTVSRTDPRTGRLIQGLNENYGRELLELHTVGVDAGYTQEDVFECARAFTGWGIDQRQGVFVFRAANHDTGSKRVFGLDLAAGGQKEDGERVIEHLARHPSTAAFVSRKLARRFVADDPPASLVQKMASRFLATGGDIREVLRTMIGSPEFWAPAFDGSVKPKTPIEFVASAIRAVDGQVNAGRGVLNALQTLGMPLFGCIPPTGYSDRGSDWLDPSAQINRMNFAMDLVSGALAGVSADPRAAALGGSLDSARSVAEAVSANVFGRGLPPSSIEAVSGVSSTGASVATKVVGLLLAGPDFQRR